MFQWILLFTELQTVALKQKLFHAFKHIVWITTGFEFDLHPPVMVWILLAINPAVER